MEFQKLHPDAIIPTKGTSKSAGYDLYALEERTVIGGEGSVLIPTGIAAKLRSGLYGRLAARSVLALKQHLAVNAGVVDEDYFPGHVQVVMYGTKNGYSYTVKKGERFAQLIPEMIYQTQEETSERSGGFGSTDVMGTHAGPGC